MPNHVMLDNVNHKNLKINPQRSADLGDAVRVAKVIPNELRLLSCEYGMFFSKDVNTGKYLLIAILGFDEGENLYLSQEGWSASNIPMDIQRQPFLVGETEREGDREPVVFVDLDSKRISETDGEPVFLELGGVSPYLEKMTSILMEMTTGASHTESLVNSLLELDLLEPVQLDVEFADGQKRNFSGLYTIHEENLRGLSSDALDALHKQGFLDYCYYLMASHGNMAKLIKKKNDLISG